MGNIAQNINVFKLRIPVNVTLVAVSKTKPNVAILEAYHAGHKIFGENKIQDLLTKYETLPKDINWHMIGHVQTNKVKYIAPFISLIHGVDSIKLLNVIDKEALKNQRVIDCLIQIHIAEEESKFGCNLLEAKEIIEYQQNNQLNNIRIVGVMGMATYTSDKSQIKNEFQHLKFIFEELQNSFFNNEGSFKEISMGMSGDYEIAIDEGSTMVRIGSAIFGDR